MSRSFEQEQEQAKAKAQGERTGRRRYAAGTGGLPSTYGNVPHGSLPPAVVREPWRGRNEEVDFWGQARHPETTEASLWSRVQGAFSGRGPKNYVRSDERIREDVLDRLNHLSVHADVDASEVEATVQDGEVTLTGSVVERRWKHMMEDAADGVMGVKDVHNQVRVRREDETARATTTTGTSTGSGVSTSSTTTGTGAIGGDSNRRPSTGVAQRS